MAYFTSEDLDPNGEPLWTPALGPSGSLHLVDSESHGQDVVQRLRETVAEVTHGRIPAPKHRFGFY